MRGQQAGRAWTRPSRAADHERSSTSWRGWWVWPESTQGRPRQPGAVVRMEHPSQARSSDRQPTAIQGGTMDFSRRLDELQQRVAATKAAVQAAATESREQLRQRVGQAQQAAQEPQPRAQQRAHQTTDRARSKFAQMKADATAKMDDVQAKIDQRTRKTDAKMAADEAARVEADAADPLHYAEWAVDNAQLAMLDAIDARVYADDLAKAASS